MNLLVLGRPLLTTDLVYRGTYREQPFHFDDLPEDHEANRAFWLFEDSTVESGPMSHLKTARSVLQVYRRFAPERSFELVEVTEHSGSPAAGKELLGFDVSAGFYYSLVAAAIIYVPNERSASEYNPGVFVLGKLLHRHFRGKLNKNALFDHPECAQACLDAMMALQKVQPNLYENPDVQFEVLGLYAVA